ncbi:MAG: sodium/proline symporter, partial [Cyanobacteria bacterium J06588_4]
VLLILRSYEKPVATPVAIAIMLVGIFVSMYWKLGLKLSGAVYEVFPGMAAGLLVYLIASLFVQVDKVQQDRQ